MALVTINPVSADPLRPTTLDKIAQGVGIAANILNTGLNTYKTLGIEAPQAQQAMQTQKTNTDLTLRQSGFLPVDQKSLGITEDQIQKNPSLYMKSNNQLYAANPYALKLTDIQKSLLDSQMKDAIVTSQNDPDPSKRPVTIPGLPNNGNLNIWVKNAPLSRDQQYTQENTLSQNFEKSDVASNFNNIHQVAANAYHLQQNPNPTRSDDLALMASFLKMNGARINADGLVDIQKDMTTTQAELATKYNQLMNNNQGRLDAGDRQRLINTIASTYQAQRPGYDNAYQNYVTTSLQRGLKPSANFLPPIPFAQGQHVNPNSGSMNQAAPQPTQNAQATPAPTPNGPAPNAIQRAKQMFGVNF